MTHTNLAAVPFSARGVEAEYERRIAMATPDDTARGLGEDHAAAAVVDDFDGSRGGQAAERAKHGQRPTDGMPAATSAPGVHHRGTNPVASPACKRASGMAWLQPSHRP